MSWTLAFSAATNVILGVLLVRGYARSFDPIWREVGRNEERKRFNDAGAWIFDGRLVVDKRGRHE